jgi:hypothetical protein
VELLVKLRRDGLRREAEFGCGELLLEGLEGSDGGFALAYAELLVGEFEGYGGAVFEVEWLFEELDVVLGSFGLLVGVGFEVVAVVDLTEALAHLFSGGGGLLGVEGGDEKEDEGEAGDHAWVV